MPGIVRVKVVSARDLPIMDRSSELTDAFVEVGTSHHVTAVGGFRSVQIIGHTKFLSGTADTLVYYTYTGICGDGSAILTLYQPLMH